MLITSAFDSGASSIINGVEMRFLFITDLLQSSMESRCKPRRRPGSKTASLLMMRRPSRQHSFSREIGHAAAETYLLTRLSFKLLSYLGYGHMIDNVVLIVTGTLHERDVQELLEKCHPLGMFDSIATLVVAQNMRELYGLILVDTPLASYFSECITSEDLDDMNIEIMQNTLYKAYLLAFEADRRAVNITIDSTGSGEQAEYRHCSALQKALLLLSKCLGNYIA